MQLFLEWHEHIELSLYSEYEFFLADMHFLYIFPHYKVSRQSHVKRLKLWIVEKDISTLGKHCIDLNPDILFCA